MRLTDLRDMIANVVDYDPNVETYRTQINQLINDAYYRLFATKPFTFAQKETIVKAYTDIDIGDITIVNGAHVANAIGTAFDSTYEGQIIELGGVEYTIAWVLNATTLYLTENYNGTSIVNGTAKVKFRYLDLPEDCVAVLQVARRSKNLTPQEPGRMVPLTRYEDEYYNLPLDEVNLPRYWVMADEYHVNTPRMVTISAAAAPAGKGVRTVDVSMSYVFAGRESALSTPAALTLSDTQILNVTLVALPNTTGVYRKVYVRNTTAGWRGERSVADDAGAVEHPPNFAGVKAYTLASTSFNDTFEFNSTPYNATDGTTQRIRLYPRQSANYDITVRYLYRPQFLVNDNDTPEFPSASHQIIAYMALKELFVKLDNLPQANLYDRKVAQEMLKLEQRYLTQIPRRFIKRGMVDGSVDPLPLYTPLTHT